MSTGRGQDTATSKANTPKDDAAAARQSGQFGADKPDAKEPAAERASDKKPNSKGPEYEEGGQYPGKRPGGK
ncbi:hypothetical protein [Achromobacter arsenitoxydans]|uniref:Uncharacterized protein n=1 Tax=Achromobacter arsenitoxydans SY8 TaxID=477184 RepID=H0FBG4_9BURK|nr:hypothetical protein [Achromobacter arsenitoxydans]EHK64429.1 hypothetical protein KYC_20604 [Achromobacter arsenitoxydans SY8]